MSKPVYLKTDETRLAGAERKIRFLERRTQIPDPHPDYDPGGDGDGIRYDVENQGDTLHVEASNNIDFSVPLDVGGVYLSAFGVSVDNVSIMSGFGGSLPSGIATTGVFIFAPILTICGLPTSAPSESNRLWNDGGTLKIT